MHPKHTLAQIDKDRLNVDELVALAAAGGNTERLVAVHHRTLTALKLLLDMEHQLSREQVIEAIRTTYALTAPFPPPSEFVPEGEEIH